MQPSSIGNPLAEEAGRFNGRYFFDMAALCEDGPLFEVNET